ncbi:hypothetical protein [Prosthecobacter sp.]|uniref:hypothetical protein n=1 Tax=Prosthecobacter sp. TaxID=1965333 RepID=UPI002ABC5B87|nr:hypothetical protein [Prosthecobacter sp.]MDZ4402569.1 hypothetical protein [Prosthecobacter sp.]
MSDDPRISKNKRLTKSMRFRSALSWLLLGMLAAGLPLILVLGKTQHHYSEIRTFFEGTLGIQKVVGITFTESHGFSIMERSKWKVQLTNAVGSSITIYEKSSEFQENVPHQPEIEIKDGQIHIDDGEENFVITVQQTAATAH